MYKHTHLRREKEINSTINQGFCIENYTSPHIEKHVESIYRVMFDLFL